MQLIYFRKPDNNFGDNEWPQYDRHSRRFVEINASKRNAYGEGPRTDACRFWKHYYQMANDSGHEEL